MGSIDKSKNTVVALEMKRKFLVAASITIVSALVVGGLLNALLFREQSLESANAVLDSLIYQLESEVANEFNILKGYAHTEDIEVWVENPEDASNKRAVVDDLCGLARASKNVAFNVYTSSGDVYFFNKNITAESLIPTSTNEAEKSRYNEIKTNESGQYFGVTLTEDGYYFGIGQGIYDESGNLIGVLSSELGVEGYLSFFQETMESVGVMALFVQEDGTIVSDPFQVNEGKNLFTDELVILGGANRELTSEEAESISEDMENSENESSASFSFNDRLVVVPIYGEDVFLVAAYDYGAIELQGNRQYLLPFLTLILVFGVLYLILRNMFHKHFVIPVEELLGDLKDTNFFEKASIKGHDRDDEFGEIARSVQGALDQIANHIPTGYAVFTPERTIVRCNKRLLDMLGFTSIEAYNSFRAERLDYFYVNPSDYKRRIEKLNQRVPFYFHKVLLRNIHGKQFWVYEFQEIVEMADGKHCYQLIVVNIDEDEREKESLKKTLFRDVLTGVYNRQYFESFLHDKIFVDKDYKDVSIILLDIDHFKRVNDKYGHDIGDEVLKQFALEAQRNIREGDKIIRWGGEEFIAVILDADRDEVGSIAERIRLSVENSHFHEAEKVTVSGGVAHLENNDDFDALFKRADVALYQAKQRRNTMVEMNQ